MQTLTKNVEKVDWPQYTLKSSQDDSVAIGAFLGGSGICGEDTAKACPEFAEFSIGIDTDIRQKVSIPSISRQTHLSADGDVATVHKHRGNFSLLDDKSQPATNAPEQHREGAGMVRGSAMALLAPSLPTIALMIRNRVESALSSLRGRQPKKLFVHEVFSICGGTGSSLAIPIAALFRDTARSINPTLDVAIIAHAIGPGIYWSSLSTPGERQRAMANAAMTLRELSFAQRPENLASLTTALDISPMLGRLFDHVNYYEISSSGDTVVGKVEMRQRIAASITAGQNRSLRLLEDSREINPATAQYGTERDQGGTAVIGAVYSAIVRVPVQKIAQACARKELNGQLAEILKPASSSRVGSLHDRYLAELKLHQTFTSILEELRAVGGGNVENLAELSVPDALDAFDLAMRQRKQHGKPEQRRVAGAIAKRLETKVTLLTSTFIRRVADSTSRLAELQSVLRRAISSIQEKCVRVQTQIEDGAETQPQEAVREKVAQIRNGNYSWFFKRNHLLELQSLCYDALESEARLLARKVYFRAMLEPLAKRLEEQLETFGLVQKHLVDEQHRLTSSVTDFVSAVDGGNEFFSEVIQPAEVQPLLGRVTENVTDRFGPIRPLTLAPILEGDEPYRLRELLDEPCQQRQQQVEKYLREARDIQDIHGFIHRYGLEMDLKQWLANAADFTLPAKLNRNVHGPAHTPVRACVVMPTTLKTLWEDIVQEVNPPAEFEIEPSENPFEIIVRARISRAPFSSIPGLEEIERNYQAFLAEVPSQRSDGSANLWGRLESTGHLSGAKDVRLLPEATDSSGTNDSAVK